MTPSSAPEPDKFPVKQDNHVRILTQSDPPIRTNAWIRYRTELRHRVTGELLHRIDSDTKNSHKDDAGSGEPILELITKYETREFKPSQESSWIGQNSASAPSYSLRILSIAIINALQAIVEYYPGQNLSGNAVEVAWPYAILVHHYDELQKFKITCQSKEASELCAREKNAPEHIDHLIKFLDENIMERVIAEKNRVKKGFHTFEDIWVTYKPGRTVGDLTNQQQWRPYVISEVIGGSFVNPPTSWTIRGWTLEFDGTNVGRSAYTIEISRFDGEAELAKNTCFVDDEFDIDKGVLRDNAVYGEMWYKLLKKQCRDHVGKSLEFPYNEVRVCISSSCT